MSNARKIVVVAALLSVAGVAGALVAPRVARHGGKAAVVADEDEGKLEIEVVGKVHAAANASKYIVVAQPTPCDLDRLDATTPVGIDALEATSGDETFGFEAVLDEDERPWVCVVAFDAQRRVVGFGEASPKARPIAVARAPGEEYGRAHGLEVTVQPVAPVTLRNRAIMSRVN